MRGGQPRDRFLASTLGNLRTRLASFLDPSTGTVARVRQRLAAARAVERTAPTPAWRNAADQVVADPRFVGVTLTPQLDLVPLDKDPISGLQEFLHLPSGVAPEHDPQTQRHRVKADTGIVFVLLPPGRFSMGHKAMTSSASTTASMRRAMKAPCARLP